MGAEIAVEHGYMAATNCPGVSRLRGARITTDMVTVTGTENLLMVGHGLAEGETVLENAAQEPGGGGPGWHADSPWARRLRGSHRIRHPRRAAVDGLHAPRDCRPH